MADSMPAKTAQTPLQPGAASGSKFVTPNTPMEASAPVIPGPNPLTSDGIRSGGGSGSPLVTPAQPMDASRGIFNGGQVQGQRTNPAWPKETDGAVRAADAGQGHQTDMDVRVIDVPPPPRASQSTGGNGYGS